jgi:hypothetical protein
MAKLVAYDIPKYKDITPMPGYDVLKIDAFDFTKIGEIITQLIKYVYAIAGIALFIYLIIGGFGLLTSAGNPDSIKAAKAKIVSALVGFFIIFASFWIGRIVEIIFGITIF